MRQRVLISSILGFLGTLCVSILSFVLCRPGQSCVPIHGLVWDSLSLLVALTGLALTVIAWFLVRECRLRQQWMIFAIWILPLLFAPPVLSHDAWAYAEQGLLCIMGIDPYEMPMGASGTQIGANVDMFWKGTTTVYPPFTLVIQSWMVTLGQHDPYWSVIAMRIPALLSVIVIGLGMSDIARRVGRNPRTALWGLVLNPYVVFHFVGGVHHDAVAAALAVAAMWLTILGRQKKLPLWLVGSVLVGLAMGIKQPLGLTAIGVALFPIARRNLEPRTAWRMLWKQALWRIGVAVAITIGVFLLVSVVSGLGFGWLDGSGTPYKYPTISPSALVGEGLAVVTGISRLFWIRLIGFPVLAAGCAYILVQMWKFGLTDPIGYVGFGLAVFAFSFPSLHPWYLIWGGAFLAAARVNRSQVSIILSVSILLVLEPMLTEYGPFELWFAVLVSVVSFFPLYRLIKNSLPSINRLVVDSSGKAIAEVAEPDHFPGEAPDEDAPAHQVNKA